MHPNGNNKNKKGEVTKESKMVCSQMNWMNISFLTRNGVGEGDVARRDELLF